MSDTFSIKLAATITRADIIQTTGMGGVVRFFTNHDANKPIYMNRDQFRLYAEHVMTHHERRWDGRYNDMPIADRLVTWMKGRPCKIRIKGDSKVQSVTLVEIEL